MPGSMVRGKYDRGWIKNLAIGEDYARSNGLEHPMLFFFRPEPIRESIKVNYEKFAVLGMSHQYHGYSNTDNLSFPIELYFNRLMLVKRGAVATDKRNRGEGRGNTADGGNEKLGAISEKFEASRRYLEALTVPPVTPIGIVGNSPPPCLLVIPGIIEIRARLISLDVGFNRVDVHNKISEMRVRCVFEEAPLGRITMQDVLERGTFRTWGGV